MTRKKWISLMIAGMLAIGLLTGCGSGESEDSAENSVESQTAKDGMEQAAEEGTKGTGSTAGNADAAEETTSGSHGKILIAYFTAAENSGVDAVSSASYSTVNGEAIGRVRAVADMIQSETGGELFSIKTSVVYPANGGELIDYAAKEQDADARPELTSHIENPDDYDTIFIGYPTWLAYHNLIQCTQS